MSHKNFFVIILAAGQGHRMLSDIPKVLHQIAGKSMLQHLMNSINKFNIQTIYIVYNQHKAKLKKAIDLENIHKIPIHWILQRIPKGTGHAVQKVLNTISDNESEILILYGDVPFVSYNTLKKLKFIKSQCDISLLTATITNPNGYGRIIRNPQGKVISIIEHNNIINNTHKKIKEINSGIFISVAGCLKNWIKQLTYNYSNNELYLTDVIAIAYQTGYVIRTTHPNDIFEIIGINNKSDLIQAERTYQKKQAQNLLKSGILISDPNRFDLRGTLICGKDVYIDINVIIEGYVSLGNRVKIGSGCILKDVNIADDVNVYPFSIIEHSKINSNSKIGPFARLRPGTQLQQNTHIGNFVELKNTQLGTQSKVKHLTYLGDADIGAQVNIGAGTIICNYDGSNKNNTRIKDNAFIGADSQLIAPVTIGKHAIIGAGTTVTQDVAEKDIIISRIRQFSIVNKNLIKKIK